MKKRKVVLHQKDLRMTNNLLVSQQNRIFTKILLRAFPVASGEKKEKEKAKPFQSSIFLCTCCPALFFLSGKIFDLSRGVSGHLSQRLHAFRGNRPATGVECLQVVKDPAGTNLRIPRLSR